MKTFHIVITHEIVDGLKYLNWVRITDVSVEFRDNT